MVEWLFHQMFTILLVMMCGNFVLHRFLYARLKRYHPQTWEKLGHNSWSKRYEAVDYFLKKRDYEELRDTRLSNLSRTVRIYRRAYSGVLGMLFIVVLLGP